MAHPLTLSGSLHVARTADDLIEDVAAILSSAVHRAVEQRGTFHLALSGGSTPEPFYHHLVIDPRHRSLPWPNIHVWLVDERRVPADDLKSNYHMIRESLLDHVPVRRRHLHPMHPLSDHAGQQYESQLRAHLHEGRLDFVLLGMGADGHTASLFPHSPAIDEKHHWVAINSGPTVTPPDRVTMTLPLLNQARQIGVLVTGEAKFDALRRVDAQLRDGGPDPAQLPITGVAPVDGSLTWFLDGDAAGE